MPKEIRFLKHKKERIYGSVVLIVGSIVWIFIIAILGAAFLSGKGLEQIVIFAVEIIVFILLAVLAKMFYRAYLFGHAVLIGDDQFPHLQQALKAGAAKLGLETVPQAFLYNSNGLMNAFAMRVLGTRMVLLTSALIDVESDAQVDFVIGHELGHHAAGHLNLWMNILKLPGSFVPFLGAAYHRSRELTADRIGAFCVGDFEASRSALHMLACGSARLNARMNANAFSAQEDFVPPVTGFLLHIFSGYPRLTRRVKEIEAYFRTQRSTATHAEPAFRH
jgi:hypothetical protein